MHLNSILYFDNKASMSLISIIICFRAIIYKLFNRKYHSFNDFCWLVRSSYSRILKKFGRIYVDRTISNTINYNENLIFKYMLQTSYPNRFISKYSISDYGEQDIFRDIIILKSPTGKEKGVILLKYAQTFDAFLYFFDAESLLNQYYFVLEPCWAGYCNANLLSWLFPQHKNKVIVQCYTSEDCAFISDLMPFFIPIDLGPADWVNADLFQPSIDRNRSYDIIMVANWSPIKRHFTLFKALSEIKDRQINVLLIGYPWGGKTSEDILKQSKVIGNGQINIEIKENLSHQEVVRFLDMSKFMIFLTRKEGDNKALVEALFTDVPAIVYKDTIGGAKRKVNSSTGIFSSYEDLKENILYMLDNY